MSKFARVCNITVQLILHFFRFRKRSYEYFQSCLKVSEVIFMKIISKPNIEHVRLGRLSIEAERINYNSEIFPLVLMIKLVQQTT